MVSRSVIRIFVAVIIVLIELPGDTTIGDASAFAEVGVRCALAAVST
jgi:hypothetical protein